MNPKPQIVIHLERDIHALLKRAAAVEGRTLKRQAEYILRSSITPLLAKVAASLPPQAPLRRK